MIPGLLLQLFHMSQRMLLWQEQALYWYTGNQKKIFLGPKETKKVDGWPRSLRQPTLLAHFWKSFAGEQLRGQVTSVTTKTRRLYKMRTKPNNRQDSLKTAQQGCSKLWEVGGKRSKKAVGKQLGEKRSGIWEKKKKNKHTSNQCLLRIIFSIKLFSFSLA